VDTWLQRSDAEHAVQRLTGVRGVVNQIAVAAKAIDSNQIKRQIEAALERQAEREAKRIGIAVRDGIVTLTGAVRTWAERNAIEGTVEFSPGVRRLDSRITVDPYL
jgi:osmotically-inducible protein OsmY